MAKYCTQLLFSKSQTANKKLEVIVASFRICSNHLSAVGLKKKNMAKFKKKKKENFHKVNMYIVYVIVAYTR